MSEEVKMIENNVQVDDDNIILVGWNVVANKTEEVDSTNLYAKEVNDNKNKPGEATHLSEVEADEKTDQFSLEHKGKGDHGTVTNANVGKDINVFDLLFSEARDDHNTRIGNEMSEDKDRSTNPTTLSNGSNDFETLRIDPSNDDESFEMARASAKEAMKRERENFYSEELPLSQKEILQAILLAEDAANSGQANFSTKDKIHDLEKVHVPSLDEEEQYGKMDIIVPAEIAKPTRKVGLRGALQFLNGFKERKSNQRTDASIVSELSGTSQSSNFI